MQFGESDKQSQTRREKREKGRKGQTTADASTSTATELHWGTITHQAIGGSHLMSKQLCHTLVVYQTTNNWSYNWKLILPIVRQLEV